MAQTASIDPETVEHLSVEQWCQLPEDTRGELIDGQPSPATARPGKHPA